MNVKSYFSDLKSTLEERNGKIKTALEFCRTEEARIKGRYSETVAAEKLARLETDTRAAILKHDQEARDKAERLVNSLRGVLSEQVTSNTDPGLLAQLQAAKTFGLKLTRSEVEAMAQKGGGDPVALACLAQIAEASSFHVTFTTVKTLEQDLKKILSMFGTPSLYAPDNFTHEAIRYLPNRTYKGIDYGRPDVAAITVGQAVARNAVRDLDEMSARWSDPGRIELKELPPIVQ